MFKNNKRLLSFFLAMVLILTSLPVGVLAEGLPSGELNSTNAVKVIVENTKVAKDTVFGDPLLGDSYTVPWDGELVNEWVEIKPDSTMMSLVVEALTNHNYEQKGAESNYISEVHGLAAFDAGQKSGWMGTLNDWFTNEGFGEFTVAKNTLHAGDEIRIMYTLDWGKDLGSSWDNNDKTIKAINFSTGVLDKEFNKDVKQYTLTLPEDVDSIIITPTATNKNFLIKTFIGETEYKRTANVPVENGTVITVENGRVGWPTMNAQAGGTSDEVPGEIYTFTVIKGTPDTEKPVITINPTDTDVKVEKGVEYTLPVAIVTDNVDENLTATVKIEKDGTVVDAVDTSVVGTYVVTYTAKDSSNNEAEPVVVNVTVEDAEEPPVEDPTPKTKFTVPTGASVEVASKVRHYYPFVNIAPSSIKDNGDGTTTFSFDVPANKKHIYQVNYPGKAKYSESFTVSNIDNPPEFNITLDKMGEADFYKYVYSPASGSNYPADIYLNVEGTGHLSLNTGATYQLRPLRSWQVVENTITSTDTPIVEPNFHYEVINKNGVEDNSVVEINESGELSAKNSGTAIVLVTYDAINVPTSGGLFSSIWPENTGVFVVTVDGSSNVNSNTTINEDLNVDHISEKISGLNLDAEHDPIYYLPTEQYGEYTFKPEDESTVELLKPTIANGKLTFNGGFNSDGVVNNGDGSYTVQVIKGKNILKVAKGENVKYQVIKAKETNITITNNTTKDGTYNPGDKITVVFDVLFHPSDKLAAVYNFGPNIQYKDSTDKIISGGGTPFGNYAFPGNARFQTVNFTIPNDWAEKEFSLKQGVLKINGFGDPIGNHRNINYETGLNANFNAIRVSGFLGKLPDLVFEIEAKVVTHDITITTTPSDATVVVTKKGDTAEIAPTDGVYKLEEGEYTAKVSAEGYAEKTVNFIVPLEGNKLEVALEEVYNGPFTIVKNAEGTEITITGYETRDVPLDLVIPETIQGLPVTKIAKDSFKFSSFGGKINTPLTSITFPEGLKEIGYMAFQGNAFETVTLPASLEKLDSRALAINPKLKTVTFADGIKIKEIPDAFYGTGLESVVVPEGVEKIGESAFHDTPLKSITLPSTIKEIQTSAFALAQIEEFVVPETVENLNTKPNGSQGSNGLFFRNFEDKEGKILRLTKVYDETGIATPTNTKGIVNPVSVTLKYVDKDSKEEIKETQVVVGRELKKVSDTKTLIDGDGHYFTDYKTPSDKTDYYSKFFADMAPNYFTVNTEYVFAPDDIPGYTSSGTVTKTFTGKTGEVVFEYEQGGNVNLTLQGEGLTSDPAAGEMGAGQEVTFTVKPPVNKALKEFKVNGVDKKSELTGSEVLYTYTMNITEDTTVEVTYDDATYEDEFKLVADKNEFKIGEQTNVKAFYRDVLINYPNENITWTVTPQEALKLDDKTGDVIFLKSGTVVLKAVLDDREGAEAEITFTVNPIKVKVRIEAPRETLLEPTEIEVTDLTLKEGVDYYTEVKFDKALAVHAIVGAVKEAGIDTTDKTKFDAGSNAGYISRVGDYVAGDWSTPAENMYSGWMFYVNNSYPLISPGTGATIVDYELKDGDNINLWYIDNFMYNSYVYFEPEEYEVETGKELELNLDMAEAGGMGAQPTTLDNIVILNDTEKLLDSAGNEYKTDAEGKVKVKFNQPGTYHIAAEKLQENTMPLADEDGITAMQMNISRPYAKVVVTGEPVVEPDVFDINVKVLPESVVNPTVVVTKKGETSVISPTSPMSYKLEEGEYTVKVSADGYVANSVDFSVGESQPTTITVELREKTFGDSVDEIIKATTPVMIKNPSTSTGLNYLEALALNKSGEPVENFKEKIGIYPDYVTQNIPKNVISVVAVEGDPSNYNDTNHLTKLPKSVNALSGMSVEETVINLIAMDKAGIKYDETAAMNLLLGKLTVEGDKALVINVEDDGWGYEEETRDTNETAWALIGLAKYKDNSATQDKIAKAKNYLKGQIQDNGNALREWVGYPKKDIQTTALIAQAAVRLGEDPTDWTNSNGKSLIDGIVAGYQGDGVFKTPDGMTSNLDRPHAFAALVDYRNKESMFGPSIEAPTPVDKTDLEKAITNAEAVEQVPTSTDGKDIDKDKTWTTAEELKAFEDAIKAAKDVNTKEDATQEEVDNAVTALNNAVETYKNAKKAGTKEEPADKEALQTAITNAEKVDKVATSVDGNDIEKDKTWTTTEELTAFENAIITAKEVNNKENATQEEVNNAVTALNNAVEAYNNAKRAGTKEDSAEVNKEVLQNLVDKAKEKKEEDYIKETWKSFEEALKEAEAVLEKEDATQEEVNSSKLKLEKALKNLRKPTQPKPEADKEELDKLIIEAEKIDEKPYTQKSNENLSSALRRAKEVMRNPKVTQHQVDQEIENLQKVIRELERLPEALVSDHYNPMLLDFIFAPSGTTTKPLETTLVEQTIKYVIGSKNYEKTVNGSTQDLNMDIAPYIKNDRTMVPLRYVGEALGYEVFWEEETRTAILKNKDTEIQIQIDSDKFTVNGVEHEFDSRPEIVEGRTMLSISNIGRALGMEEGKDIFWNGETREVTIIKNVTITIK